jgi:hypothetical protein
MTLPEIMNDIIKYDPDYYDIIKYDPDYCSNPDNVYHQHYQRAINRQFSVLIFFAFSLMLYFNLGFMGILALVFPAVAVIASLVAVGMLLHLLWLEVIPSCVSWLKGK